MRRFAAALALILAAAVPADAAYTVNGVTYTPLPFVIVDSSGNTISGTGTTKETLNASATSPMACTGANTVILNANATRHSAVFQNVGTADLFICLHATTCAADGSVYDFVLKAASGANKGDGGSFSITGQGTIWGGGITCGGGVGGKLAVYAY